MNSFYRSTAIFLVLAALAVAPVLSQTDDPEAGPGSPEETDIILPTLLLRIEDIAVEDVRVALPDPSEIPAPRVSAPLPDETQLYVPDIIFGLPDPGAFTIPPTGESSFFSTGILGVGNRNSIMGGVSLYKLGVDPRFRFQFSHDALDGFQRNPVGAGFFSRTDTIDAWIASRLGAVDFDVEAAFLEKEDGLQGSGTGTYYSVNLRRLDGSASLVYRPEEIVLLGFELVGDTVEKVVSVRDTEAEPVASGEINVSPRAYATLTLPTVALGLDLKYDLKYRAPVDVELYQAVSLSANADIVLSETLVIEGDVGVRWNPVETFSYPFTVGVIGTFAEDFTVSVSGGLRFSQPTRSMLWRDEPMLDLSTEAGRFSTAQSWFGGAGLTWRVPEFGMVLDAGTEFSFARDGLVAERYDDEVDAFAVSYGTIRSFTPRVNLQWSPIPALQLDATWRSTILDRWLLDPAHLFSVSIDAIDSNERFGGGASGEVRIYDSIAPPILGMNGFFRVTDGVEFVLELSDILAPLLEHGRPRYGGVPGDLSPFIEPGFRVTVTTQISL